LGFTTPTAIQKSVLPVLLAGRDALVRAQTGSGKTISLPYPPPSAQAQQPRISRGEGTFALILAPTRELSLQVFDVAAALLKRYHWLVSGLVIGGENRQHEKARLRKGVAVLVASPGRLLDHLEKTASFRTSELRWLVLDEADRLLDLGFEAKLRQITELLNQRSAAGAAGSPTGRPPAHHTPPPKHTTLSPPDLLPYTTVQQTGAGLQLLASGGSGGAATAAAVGGGDDPLSHYSLPASLRQCWMEVPAKERLMALAALLRNRAARRRVGGSKAVVFVASCDEVEFLHYLLGDMWEAAAGAALLPRSVRLFKLHGDMQQAQRTETFAGFSQDGDGVLLCTDVAARGLDFPNVTTIIQYDVPGAPAE
ncbi:hypothetical protein VOLCADRAFT_60342, partial [Volvox carteri f. nagariensis]